MLAGAAPSSIPVPRGRLGYDLGADNLLLHTFQAPAAWQQLIASGTLRAVQHAGDALDPVAYGWMADVLAERTGQPWAWPLWAWARTTRASLVSEARRYARMVPGTVLLTLRVPATRVLLSEFADWHCVLNRIPILPSSLSDTEFDAAFGEWFARADDAVPDRRAVPLDLWPPDLARELVQSWERVFSVGSYPRHSQWQACLAEIRTDDVIASVTLGDDPDAPP